MNERIKLPRDVIRAIEHLAYDLNKSHEEILVMQEDRIDFNIKWELPKLKPLNSLSYKQLKRALYQGFTGDDFNIKTKSINNKNKLTLIHCN